MKISAGIIIVDGKNILLGHSTGNSHWDIPKGEVEEEGFLETALRETLEEFGLDLSNENLMELGSFAYLKKKSLYLFKVRLNELPLEKCVCNSFFLSKKGKEVPEIDDFGIFSYEEGISKLNQSMQKVFIEHNLI